MGKTTCAAALAIRAARAGFRTLIVSTDPAPSLGDVLGQPLGRRPRRVRAVPRFLHAAEVNAADAFEEWVSARRARLEQIALRGTWLDEADVARLLRLSLPGIDEIAALFEIVRHAASRRYDRIIVDTAPTGHTLRMFAMPAVLRGVATVFDHMQDKHRVMVAALRGGWTPDAADLLVQEIDRQGSALAELLRDSSRTRITWVTLPEIVAVEETADALAALQAAGIAVGDLIVNRLTPPPDRQCRWCTARRADEARAVRAIRGRLARRTTRAFGLFARAREPRGIDALASIGRELEELRMPPMRTARLTRVTASIRPFVAARSSAAPDAAAIAGTRLVMFGGKGGVGKTTCAAAFALDAARARRRQRVLLLSVDPAHSLGDVLGQPLSDEPRAVRGAPPNLRAREIDAVRRFEALRSQYRVAIDALFDRFTRGGRFDAVHDRQVMHDLIDLAPPGIDELMAIIEVTEALLPEGKLAPADVIVMDTAPTGHALRLLEMPAMVQEWARALMAILLKYQPVVGVGELGALLLRVSKGLGRLRDLLADGERTAFIVVTRPAAVPRAETVRLLRRLGRMRITSPVVIVNAAGAGDCAYCAAQDKAQRGEVKALAAAAGRRRSLVIAPGQMPPPCDAAALQRWRGAWRAAISS